MTVDYERMRTEPTSGPSTTKPLYGGTAKAHKHDGGPAFPRAGLKLAGGVDPSTNGMSLRDWFAGMALAASNLPLTTVSAETISAASYELADAMLADREKADD